MHVKISDADGVDALIHPGERMDDLQLAGLRILQRESGFCFGLDAVLLADFARIDVKAMVADFGTGTGILPLLLIGRGKGAHFEGFEIQADMADMARRSMQLNGVDTAVVIHTARAEDAAKLLPADTVDAVVCNPPYGLSGTTQPNTSAKVSLARHQASMGLLGWFQAAERILRGKGRFSMVYPATQMLEAMRLMEAARLTPKRFRLVYPSVDRPAKLVLIEAVRQAKPLLHPEPPLILADDAGNMSEELRHIYHMD